MEDYIKAHEFSSNHMAQLKKIKNAVAFTVWRTFLQTKSQIGLSVPTVSMKKGLPTAPYCGIDSVIGESSGYPITKDFLTKMNKYWFR